MTTVHGALENGLLPSPVLKVNVIIKASLEGSLACQASLLSL